MRWLLTLLLQDGVTDVEGGRTMFHDSGSSLTDRASPAGDDAAAAHCWDIDASDIVICKRPDGSDWLLNVSESGEVNILQFHSTSTLSISSSLLFHFSGMGSGQAACVRLSMCTP